MKHSQRASLHQLLWVGILGVSFERMLWDTHALSMGFGCRLWVCAWGVCFGYVLCACILGVCFRWMFWVYVLGICDGSMLWAYTVSIWL